MTGSTGLIGTRIQEQLSDQYFFIGIDVAKPKKEMPGRDWFHCDLTRDASVQKTLAEIRKKYGKKFASVIHLAAHYDFSGADSPLYRKLTIDGSRRLIQSLQSFEVEQFLFSSTLLVMKPVEEAGEKITETSELQAQWAYPQSKIAAEKTLRENQGDIPLVLLRLAGAYDEAGHSPPICQQIKRIYEKQLESYFYPGTKESGQAFIHLDDLVDCVAKAIEKRKTLEKTEVFLVAEPDLMSYEDLQGALGELIHGKEWPTLPIPKPIAKLGAWIEDKIPGKESFIKPWMVDMTDDHYPVEIKRAQTRLGWQPKRRLRDVLPQMVANLKANPKKFYELNHLPLAPDMVGRRSYEKTVDLDAIPEPWDYNPSGWNQRIPICLFAAVAMVIAAYMGLYQWRLLGDVWDPVFGDQSKQVLDSDVSHQMSVWFRVPDAIFGVLAYLGDILFALAGSTRRWQFRPWLVVVFGIDVIPLGIVSVILVLMQAFVVGNWCFLCLVTAFISLILIYFAYDEVWSCLLFLKRVWKKTKSASILWKTFWGFATPEAYEVGQKMIRRK